jgi:heavy metal translocating P-type ATPase
MEALAEEFVPHSEERWYAARFAEVGSDDLLRIAFAGAAALLIWTRAIPSITGHWLFGVVAVAVAGLQIFREAVSALLHGRMTMELSMSIAILAALAIREPATALLILLFVLVAEVLEEMNLHRGRRAIGDLVDLLPSTAFVRDGENIVPVPAATLKVGDLVVVKPGGRVPVDGVVTEGFSAVDQASVTGESMPAEKITGSQVYAGTLNQTGMLTIRVERIGRETTFGKIIEAVEQSESSRAPVQKLADRLAAWLVVVAVAAALLTLAVTHNVRRSIAVVIVAGACGVAAGTPLAILAGIGRSARQRVIVKGGMHLETLAKVDTVIFDKTGTLTLGEPRVVRLDPAGTSEEELLRTAATAERGSEHPIAKAILRAANERGIQVQGGIASFQALPGRGLVCLTTDGHRILIGTQRLLQENGLDATSRNDGAIFVERDGAFLGTIEIADVPRASARKAVEALRERKIHTVLLTGDHESVARSVAAALGVDDFSAELLPEGKQEAVRDRRARGHIVAMVGDGINDAPALLEANVGVAMGSGTAVTRESADVVLLGDDPMRIVDAIDIARRCRGVIVQNFVGTIGVDVAGMICASIGILPPVAAAVVHVVSELLFILNSARLLPSRHMPAPRSASMT